jgi:uncharacterized protein (DUF2336 family)
MNLTLADVEKVRTGRLGPEVADTAERVAAAYCETAPASSERQLAEGIIAIFLENAAQEVREALARQLDHCQFLPRPFAQQMARDVETVAIPVLRGSAALWDEDILEIIAAGSTTKQVAVAGRRIVPHAVVEKLLATGKVEVACALVGNEGAKLSEIALHRIVDAFPGHDGVHEAIAGRPGLPLSVTERLFAMVADHLRARLIQHFQLPEELARGGPAGVRGAAPPRAAAQSRSQRANEVLVDHLQRTRRLTPTFLLRVLCDGQIDLFELGMAQLAYVPVAEARKLLRAKGALGQAMLYQRAGIAPILYQAFNAAVDVMIRGVDPTKVGKGSQDKVRRVITRVVREYDDINPAALEAVLTRLYQKVTGAVPRPQLAAVA